MMSEKPSLLDLYPEDTPDYMVQGWVDALLWAVGSEDVMARFRQDTGLNWRPARNGLEQMIDRATGAEWSFVEAFTRWFNVNVWGSMDGPIEDDLS